MPKRYNYCTLFNKKYFSRGLALHKSLIDVGAKFRLFILAMDMETAEALRRLRLAYVTVITLNDFEDVELKEVKKTRTLQEYCWTCTPSIIQYCIKIFKLAECTYLDADIYFFAKPEVLQREFRNKSILITEHRYHPDYDYTTTSGRFCVQYVSFRNDAAGMEVLEWWRNACNTWCYARYEDGKFGDQLYLDDWPERFESVHILQSLGGGIAPWNLMGYDVDEINGKIFICPKAEREHLPLVFYHFHDFRLDAEGQWFHASGFPGYHIGSDAYRYIYARYLKTLYGFKETLKNLINTDLPALPQTLPELQFDKILVPNSTEPTDKILLREVYKRVNSQYQLTKGLSAKLHSKIFTAMVAGGYNLDRYTDWPYPGNFIYGRMHQVQKKVSLLRRILLPFRNLWLFQFLNKIRHKVLRK